MATSADPGDRLSQLPLLASLPDGRWTMSMATGGLMFFGVAWREGPTALLEMTS